MRYSTKSKEYKTDDTLGTNKIGTKKRQVHFGEDKDITEPLKRFCSTRKIGDRELRPEDVYKQMMRYLLFKRGFLNELKQEKITGLEVTAADLGMTEEQCNIAMRKIDFYRNRKTGQ
ncbi:MAG: hypothetical protein IMZ53_12845 [Thermoplasmata archaeon]|nr:hypothetical protein [Thermoplasmata archaeon]